MAYSKAIILGNLTRDPELRVTPSGTAVANFTIAVNRKFKAGAEDKEEVAFLDCKAFTKTAENIAKFFTKGKPIFVDARIGQDKWTDKNTQQERTKIVFIVENFQFAGGDKPEQSQQQRPAQRSNSMPNGAGQGGASAAEPDVPFMM